MLKLPQGAEAAFRIEAIDAFENRFAINVYGAGRDGWFVATNRVPEFDRDSGVSQLAKGEWANLLHLIDHCGFWSLPEDGSHLNDPTCVVEDGEWLTITGRDGTRHHRVHRFLWREQGLEAVLSFGRRVCGFFVRHPVSGAWTPLAETGQPADSPSRSSEPAAPHDAHPSMDMHDDR